jgi:signal transduction histidine kinase
MDEGGTLEIGYRVQSIGSSGQDTRHTLTPKPYTLIITISDTGCGISVENLKKLFTPFQTTKKGGIGLGLSITREIIKQHGGEIRVTSEIGKGTEFIVALPAL